MGEFAAGLSQGAATGYAKGAEQRIAANELNQRKRQFEDQKKISLAAQGFMVDAQGNVIENPDSPVSKARALEMQRVQAEIAKIAGETPSPAMKGARERGAIAEASDMETRAEQSKLSLEGEKAADFYNKAPGAKLRGLEAGVRGQELQNEATAFTVENQQEAWGWSKRQQAANIKLTEANTVAAKEGAKNAAAQRRNIPIENARQDQELALRKEQAEVQTMTAIAGIMNQALQGKQAGETLQLQKAQVLTNLFMSSRDKVSATEEFYIQQYMQNNGGIPPDATEAMRLKEAANFFAPDVLTAFDIAAGIMEQEPASQEIIAKDFENILGVITSAADLPPERQQKIKAFVQAQTAAMGLKASAFADDAPTSQPTSQPAGAKAPGLPKPKASPISLVREKLAAPKTPATDGALKFPVMPTEPVARAARQEADRAVTTAYGAMDDWHKKRLAGVAGAPNVAEAVSRLNKEDRGRWAVGPNAEIVALPSEADLMEGYLKYGALYSRVLDKMSKGRAYAAAFSRMQEEGRIPSNANPADPVIVKKVIALAENFPRQDGVREREAK